MKKLSKIWKQFLKKLKAGDTATLLYISAVSVFLTALIIGIWLWDTPADKPIVTPENSHEQQDDEDMQEDTCELRRALDGECVENEDEVHKPLVGVMIENHIDAQPLSGVQEARVVYEAPVEGGITRFLALFPIGSDVSKVGPVRSARPYYLDWVSEYADMMYMHVGGSPEALQNIKTYALFDMDEFGRGWYFWRDQNRYAPHNAYTSSELWQRAQERYANETQTVTYDPWLFRDIDTCVVSTSTKQGGDTCVDHIDVTFRGAHYGADWYYDADAEVYEREQFGRPHRDASGKQIVADTLIVQYVSGRAIDAVGRLDIDTIGTGDALVFKKGHLVEGMWQKESRTARTKYVDEDGKEISLAPGKIWVTVVTQVGEVVW